MGEDFQNKIVPYFYDTVLKCKILNKTIEI